ncbi:MAG: class I SAM-dependent methyltransferase [Candidatus Hodarchaeota archaeon]
MTKLRKYFAANRKMWDEFAKAHYGSKTYKTNEFLAGETTLNSIELDEVGDVSGKTLLHLQCHFGLDTLSWARMGAKVTGVDFSGEAIRLAEELTKKTGLHARFVKANVYDLREVLDEEFDIVFTSYGVTCWLNDLGRWAEIVTHFLRSGGIFYIADFHPLLWVFDWDATDDFSLKRSYFHNPNPEEFEVDGTYADTEDETGKFTDYEWAHSLGDIVTAIANAGMQIEFLHEFPKAPFQNFPFWKKGKDGYWYYDNPDVQLPLVFSIKATKLD